MASNISVKVIGFQDAERHSLNTLFRLSVQREAVYSLWTSDGSSPPQVALIDMDSYQSELEMASPSFNSNLKLICVGETSVPHAWRSFQRPIDWKALVETLDELFVVPPAADIDIDLGAGTDRAVRPGVKVSLLAGLTREDRLYLRARLAVAGMTEVDEAETAEAALIKANHRHYDLAIVGLELNTDAPWSLVQALKSLPTPVESVIAVTANPSWKTMEEAEMHACTGLLEIPFSPRQILAILRKV